GGNYDYTSVVSGLEIDPAGSDFSVRFDLDTKQRGPMFNVQKSGTLNERDWNYMLPRRVATEVGVETWMVETGGAVDQLFIKINVWP
ncbi:hypothetical protein, partial [Pelagicoccus mobilis]